VSPARQEVDPTGGRYPLAITRATGTCGWEAGTDADWVFLSSNSGSGTDAPTFFARQYGGVATRTATITIAWSGGRATLTIVQPGKCGYTVLQTQQSDVLPSGDTRQSAIQNTGVAFGGTCHWQATSNADWIMPLQASGSDSNGFLQYRVAANPSGTPRTGTITVSWPTGSATMPTASATITVTQFGKCAYSASPGGTIDVPATGGQVTVRMTRTSGACSWRAGDPSFGVILPTTYGGDGDTFTFTVVRNSTGTVMNYNVYISLGFYTGYMGKFQEDPGPGNLITITVRQAAS
jgi:hypothetical protein